MASSLFGTYASQNSQNNIFDMIKRFNEFKQGFNGNPQAILYVSTAGTRPC